MKKNKKPPINRTKKEIFTYLGVTYTQGSEVEVEVFWPGGGRSSVRGTLIMIAGDEAYVESQFGAIVGNADTLVTV